MDRFQSADDLSCLGRVFCNAHAIMTVGAPKFPYPSHCDSSPIASFRIRRHRPPTWPAILDLSHAPQSIQIYLTVAPPQLATTKVCVNSIDVFLQHRIA
jgi:hypothetical protein